MSLFEEILEQLDDKNRIIVVDAIANKEYDYNLFSQDVLAVRDYLESLPNKQIIIREHNSYELLVLYFAVMFSDKVIIPVDPEKEEQEVKTIRKMHEDSFFIDVGEARLLMDSLQRKEGSLPWTEVDKNRLYLITYTSGSTGEPKGVKHNLNNLFLSAYEFGHMMHYNSNTIMGHCMPMTYMAGILNTIIMPYIMNGQIVILPRFAVTNAFDFWNKIKENSINTLWLSPTMLRILNLIDKKVMMREYFHDAGMKISVGTAPLDKQLRDDFEKKYDIRIYQSYGLSETLFISTEVVEEKESKHTVGHLLPSVKLIYDVDGEIQISVPWIFLGYINADTSLYLKDGKYLSGDLGEMKDGNLIITGRKKEIIVKGGYNVNPRDIENFVLDNNLAEDCAIVAVNVQGEELIGAYMVSKSRQELRKINERITETLGKHHIIDYMEYVTNLPLNLNGKVDKIIITKELEKKYGIKN